VSWRRDVTKSDFRGAEGREIPRSRIPVGPRAAGDFTKSDFRDADVRENAHLAHPVTKMPGTSLFRASLVPFRA
jgi:hypothetical protein